MELCRRYNIKMQGKDAVDWALFTSIEDIDRIKKKNKKEEQNQEENSNG